MCVDVRTDHMMKGHSCCWVSGCCLQPRRPQPVKQVRIGGQAPSWSRPFCCLDVDGLSILQPDVKGARPTLHLHTQAEIGCALRR